MSRMKFFYEYKKSFGKEACNYAFNRRPFIDASIIGVRRSVEYLIVLSSPASMPLSDNFLGLVIFMQSVECAPTKR